MELILLILAIVFALSMGMGNDRKQKGLHDWGVRNGIDDPVWRATDTVDQGFGCFYWAVFLMALAALLGAVGGAGGL